MQIILKSEKDVLSLTGKFIIQIDSDTPDATVTEKNWDFYQEKRISLVCGLRVQGFFYDRTVFETWESFAEWFNNYAYPSDKNGENKGKRFHRLLSSAEIDLMCKKLKGC